MANQEGRVRVALRGGNWNSLNPLLNESPALNDLLDRIQKKVLLDARNNARASGSKRAKFVTRSMKADTVEPGSSTGLKMRFVRAADIGFEMRYNSLRKALDEQ